MQSEVHVYAGGRNDISSHVTGLQHTTKFKTTGSIQENGSFCKPTLTMPYKLAKTRFCFQLSCGRVLHRPVQVMVHVTVSANVFCVRGRQEVCLTWTKLTRVINCTAIARDPYFDNVLKPSRQMSLSDIIRSRKLFMCTGRTVSQIGNKNESKLKLIIIEKNAFCFGFASY